MSVTEPGKVLASIGQVVAPTTVATGLMFFFGWSHAFWFFDYFGVHASTLELSVHDYLIRSVNGLFVPLVVGALAVSALLWLGKRDFTARWLTIGATALGVLLTAVGLVNVFGWRLFAVHFAVPPLCLAAGVLLLAHNGKARGVAVWTAAFVMITLSLFWAVNDYSAAVGVAQARAVQAELPTYPEAVLYSAKSLNLRVSGVRETDYGTPDAAYRYRYDGLKLVVRSGGQYLFLPASWAPGSGVAVLVPRTDSVRVEFGPRG
ncbi:hypothetical protein ABZ816_37860 [Actinosynnema sp. NPDC047251]|uniref:hypothetical protein n=1 Tax=Saccharothrix espanaensis TaxID=103731 RepID=UPI00059C75C8|nr:hypothetical protein [Saccharothrix espanaensis]